MYPCASCGYLTMEEPPGSYDICPICFWEDDALQLEFATTLAGGANGVTLAAAQQAFAATGVCEGRLLPYVRPPTPGDHRDPTWRPIDPAVDSFEDWNAKTPRRAPDDPETLYYWRPTFWHRDRVT